MSVVFLREGDLSLDSRALKELSVIDEYKNVEVVGMDDFGMKEDSYTYKNQHFKITNYQVRYHSRLGHIWALIKYYFFAFKKISKNRSDIDFIYAVNMWLGLVAFVAYKIYKIPYIYDIYDSLPYTRNYPTLLRKIMVYFERIVINSSDSTIIVSDERVEQISKARPKRLEIIYNSPEIDSASLDGIKKDTDKYRVVYIGGLAPYRAIPELLAAIADLPDFELIIGGDGALRELVEEYANKYSNITYVGRKKYEDVLKIEQTADALTALYDPAIPNHKYASPNKFFESFALGKPVLMFKDTGMDSWLLTEDAGVVIQGVNKESVENGLVDIREKYSGKQNELKERMQSVFNKKFSWNLMKIKLSELIQNVGEENHEKN